MEIQSTLGFLKNPPEEYLMPGVDLLGGLSTMREMLQNGTYEEQYDFITDLNNLVGAITCVYILLYDGGC